MKVGVMQPYFFPYLGYWQLMNLVDRYVIFDDVNYIKRGWINRNQILLNGNVKRINLQIKDASQNRLIKDTQLADPENDKKSLLSILEQAYKKAPYFNTVYSLIERILSYPENNLALFLKNQIEEIHDYLGMRSSILLSSQIEKDCALKGESKIIAICCQLGADCYINAVGGVELYDQEHFIQKGMDLKFLRMNEVKYQQFDNEFVPNLSIIDVMMFNSPEEIRTLLDNYTLFNRADLLNEAAE